MRRALYIFLTTLACGCFLYAGVWFFSGQLQKSKDGQLAEQFHQAAAPMTPPPSAPADSTGAGVDADAAGLRFGPLIQINPDLIGWITIGGTAIDYPVVRGEDNEKYLKTDFYGDSSKWGSIFMDFRCEPGSGNQILYGHHMKDGAMFHDLTRYREPAFFQEHQEIRLYYADGAEEIYHAADILYWDASANNSTTFYEHISQLDYGGKRLLCLTTCDDTAGNSHMALIAVSAHD